MGVDSRLRRFHAQGQRMVDRLLDCDDPGIAGDALDQFGYLRGRAISLGARLRPLVSLASGARGSQPGPRAGKEGRGGSPRRHGGSAGTGDRCGAVLLVVGDFAFFVGAVSAGTSFAYTRRPEASWMVGPSERCSEKTRSAT